MEDVNRQQSYRRWLYKIVKKHLYEWVAGISCGIKEYEFDINGDGRKELIVWGVETERDEMRTAIFGRCKGKVYRVILRGEPIGISTNGIMIEQHAHRWEKSCKKAWMVQKVISLNKEGKVREQLLYQRVIQYSENYERVISVKKRCFQNQEGRKLRISQSDYRKELEKYNFQKDKKGAAVCFGCCKKC